MDFFENYTDQEIDDLIKKLERIKFNRQIDNEKKIIFESKIYNNFCDTNSKLKDNISIIITEYFDWKKQKEQLLNEIYYKDMINVVGTIEPNTQFPDCSLNQFENDMGTTNKKFCIYKNNNESNINFDILECLSKLGFIVLKFQFAYLSQKNHFYRISYYDDPNHIGDKITYCIV